MRACKIINAVIVGERTWGKGSVQNVIPLEGGSSARAHARPVIIVQAGKNIHRFPKATDKDVWGVMPDEGYDLRMSDQEMKDLFKVGLDREEIRPDGTAPKSTFVDRQLDAGIALIKQLAEGKPIIEQPVEKTATEEKKADAKKANEKESDDTSMTISPIRTSFVDAILEFWQLPAVMKLMAM